MSKKYTLHLTEKQARIIVNALDLYSRIGMGQLKEVVYILRQNPSNDENLQERNNRIQILRDNLEELSKFWTGGSWYYSITSNKISDMFRIAWDIQQVIRHRIAWDRNPKGNITVDFDNPLKTSDEQLPIIEEDNE